MSRGGSVLSGINQIVSRGRDEWVWLDSNQRPSEFLGDSLAPIARGFRVPSSEQWCTRVLDAPIRSEPQDNNRHRFWAEIPELDGRYLRVITLEDKVTIHNAFPDRRFKP
jgi:hypothetical protein